MREVIKDPATIARKLGAAQRRAMLALSADWGPSGDHRACIRLWYRNDISQLLDHAHQTDDCWKLRPIGLAVQAVLKARTHAG